MKIKDARFELDMYEECPCGSEQKFKFCCRDKARADSKPTTNSKYPDGRINKILHDHWGATDFKHCFIENGDCEGNIKAAHSIQNNRILNRISEDGHVYLIDAKVEKKDLTPYFNKISKNKASTFFGFCDYHDTEIFKSIEISQYENTRQQNFLFAYRAYCVSYHKVVRKMKSYRDTVLKYPATLLNPESINMYRVNQLDIRDGEIEFEAFTADLKDQNFSNINSFTYTLNYEVNFAVSTSFAIDRDMNRKIIQNTYDLSDDIIMPKIYLNVFPIEGESKIIISYHKDHEDIYFNLLEQLAIAKEESITKYLSYMIFDKSEDVYYRPSTISNLEAETKESLIESYTAFMNPLRAFEAHQKGLLFKFNLFEL